MKPRIGDRLIIEGHKVGTPPREGEVTSISGPTLTVQWDDGHESVFVPGPDCRVIRSDEEEARARRERFGARIELRVVEDGDHCDATATLMTQRGTFEGRGSSRRHPDDPNIPMIGEELAIGRALYALADEMMDEGMKAATRDEEPAEEHLLT